MVTPDDVEQGSIRSIHMLEVWGRSESEVLRKMAGWLDREDTNTLAIHGISIGSTDEPEEGYSFWGELSLSWDPDEQ